MTRIILGADGTLPELVVHEGTKPEAEKKDQQNSKPMLMAIALCFSAVMSVLMLFVDTQPSQSRSQKKSEARQHLAKYYIGDGSLRYQQIVRNALADSNHGNERAARARYRQLLKMLYSEDHSHSIGLTGPKSALSPPSDHDLEEKLSILLSN